MKEALALLRNRNMALLLSARIVSSGGDWLYNIALSIAIYRYSGSSVTVGLLWLFRFIPNLVLGPLAGAFADRIGYKRSMIIADLSRMVLIAVLAATLTRTNWPIIYPFAVVVTSFTNLFRPAGVGIIPTLVRSKEERLAANAATVEVESIAGVIGSALGGVIAGMGLITQLLLIEAATFGFSALTLLFIHPLSPAAPGKRAVAAAAGGFWQGFRLLAQRPLLVFAATVMVLPEFASGAVLVWIVPYSVQSLHLGNAGVGYLYSAYGIGSMAGGLVAAALGSTVRLDRMLALSVAVTGVALALFGIWSVAIAALVFIAIQGLAETVEYTVYQTLLQQAVPEDMVGQASGTMSSLFFNMLLLGNLASGLLVAALGLTLSILGLGTLIVAAAAFGWWRLRAQIGREPNAVELARIPAFANVPLDVREWAVRRMMRERFPPGAVVIRQGEEGDTFYAIADGKAEVEVVSDGQVSTHELGPGDFFGEIALLKDVPRTATVKAVDELTVFALSREDFRELQARAGELKESLLETATARLEEDTNFKLALATRA